ncbi:hypothetical protein [Lentzea sp. NPDC060358]
MIAMAVEDGEVDLVGRRSHRAAGTAEDPVTGSAHCTPASPAPLR